MIGVDRHELSQVGVHEDCIISLVVTCGLAEALHRKRDDRQRYEHAVRSRSGSVPLLRTGK